MMSQQQELGSQRRKRKQALEAVPTTEPESQPHEPPAKRQKQSYSSRSETPAEFWDNISRVPLCRRALREFNRQAIRPIAPQQRCTKRDVEDSRVEQLQRFARRGGPDLRSIRGYPEHKTQAKMRSKRSRSNRSSALKLNTEPTPLSSKDAAFEQVLIDNGIYPPEYDDGEPDNLEEILEKLRQPRSSLSISNFSRDDFLHFKRKNGEATTEAKLMSEVFPMIAGKTSIPSGYNQVFNNLKPLAKHISKPQPDYFNGSRPAKIRPKVRDDLEQYIIPSSQQDRPALPNFFMEAKSRDGKASIATRQITQDLAVGARGMLKMQSYGSDEPVFDNKAHTFASSYHSGTGTLQLFAMHPTKPGATGGRPEYHTTQIDTYGLTGNANAFRQGIGAWRNLRDFAEERRVEFIASANETADNDDEPEVASVDTYLTSIISKSQSTQNELVTADSEHEESDSTSADELAIPVLTKKSKTARQLGKKRHKSKISDVLVDEDDDDELSTNVPIHNNQVSTDLNQ